jgi:hypothetical protein
MNVTTAADFLRAGLIDTYSEEHRRRCEVRFALQLNEASRSRATAFLADVAKKRGQSAAKKLEAECKQQYDRGNRGAPGDWRE